ncbi:MAG TPA: ABC transporter substrate-binding protein [Saprospiraceae bacterium]
MNRISIPLATCCILLIGLFSCKQSPEVSNFEVTIRLPNEPESLHPIFSKSIHASQIESLILLPVTEYDPFSITLTPLLITEIPVPDIVKEGKNAKRKVYKMTFRPEAVWADGQPVTAEDYLFTFKAANNPHVNAGSWKGFMEDVKDIEIDPGNNKIVSVYMDNSSFIDFGGASSINIYPAHIYDPEKIMSGFTLDELRDENKAWTPEQDSLLKRFASRFESPEFFRETVTGSGPYELDQWITGEYIRLKRKQNWWGDNIKDPPLLLQAYPSVITYRILLDAAAAEAALKAGEIDVMAEMPVTAFTNLRNDPDWKDKLQFATPALTQVYSLELNNRDSILADPRVRKALAYSLDYDGIINNLMQGLASRAIGPIHPEKSYYNNDLKPMTQDINAALALLKEAGWSDTNGNGTPDKKINGKQTELHLEIKTMNKEEGISISNIVKENASKVGFDIEIVILDPSQFLQDVHQRNFDMMPLRFTSYPQLYDPFPVWHSSSDREGGSNRTGFHSAEMDKVIEDLRSTEDPKEMDVLYKKFQSILYDQQVSIFLYVPLERIVASKRIEMKTSTRRPGYFENLLKPSGS